MVATIIGRLRARFSAQYKAAEWRARLLEAVDGAARWRARYSALHAQAKERKAREQRLRDALRAQSIRRARRTPSVRALRDALQMRIPLARRHAAHPTARDRHERFAAASAEYRRAVAQGSTLPAEARRRTIDGLTWWIPAPATRSAAAIERTILKQKIPYRSISQAGDLAMAASC